MADLTTTISDLASRPKVMVESIKQEIPAKSQFRQAGIIRDDPEYAERANAKSLLTSVPFYNPLTQTESKVPSDSGSDGEAGNITQDELPVRTNIRANGWAVADLAHAATQADPMGAIVDSVAQYWAQDEHKMAVAILAGLLADDKAESGGPKMVVGGSTTVWSNGLIAEAAATVGDNFRIFNGATIILHKDLHTLLQKAEGNAFVPASKTDIGFDTYMGYRLLVDSSIAPVDGVYTTTLIGRGFFGFGQAPIENEVAFERNERAYNFGGRSTLVNRRKFILAPRAYSQDATTMAGVSPSNTELARADMWSKGFQRENIDLAFIECLLEAGE